MTIVMVHWSPYLNNFHWGNYTTCYATNKVYLRLDTNQTLCELWKGSSVILKEFVSKLVLQDWEPRYDFDPRKTDSIPSSHFCHPDLLKEGQLNGQRTLDGLVLSSSRIVVPSKVASAEKNKREESTESK